MKENHSISEIAIKFDLSVSTLRYYEQAVARGTEKQTECRQSS